jgi:hypothetical protein
MERVREHKGISDGRSYTCLYSETDPDEKGCYTTKIVHGTIVWGDNEKRSNQQKT